MVSVKSLLLATMATTAYAAPRCVKSMPAPPKTGGTKELADPAPGLVLKKIALGYGIQNYTCADESSTSVSASGAVAVLYDVTAYHPATAKTGLTKAEWEKLPESALRSASFPLNKLPGSEYNADPAQPFPAPPEDMATFSGGPGLLRFLGHHYFDATGTPMFDLSAVGLKASVVKLDGVEAPKDAYEGPMGTGAVAWLQLVESKMGLSKGLSEVYRVITAGGAPEACSVAGKGDQSVPYATFYYFY